PAGGSVTVEVRHRSFLSCPARGTVTSARRAGRRAHVQNLVCVECWRQIWLDDDLASLRIVNRPCRDYSVNGPGRTGGGGMPQNLYVPQYRSGFLPQRAEGAEQS